MALGYDKYNENNTWISEVQKIVVYWIMEESVVGWKGLKNTVLESPLVSTKTISCQYTMASILLCFAEAGQSR